MMPLKWSNLLRQRFRGSRSSMQTLCPHNWTQFSMLMTTNMCTDDLIKNHICKDTPRASMLP